MYRTYIPGPPLADFVSLFWYSGLESRLFMFLCGRKRLAGSSIIVYCKTNLLFSVGKTHCNNLSKIQSETDFAALTQAPQMLVKEKRVSTTVYEQQRKPR